MRLIGVLLVVAGCNPGGAVSPPPDGMIMPDADGMPPTQGIFVSWNAKPPLPNISDKVQVQDATFRIEYLQVLTDLLSPDDRTTRSSYSLRWDMQTSPPQDKFPDAPLAIYRKVSISLRSSVTLTQPMLEINGTWEDEDNGGVTKPFKIIDPVGMLPPFGLGFTKQLTAGGSVSISIRVDLKDAIESVNFKNLRQVGPLLILDSGPALADFRSQIPGMFSLDDHGN